MTAPSQSPFETALALVLQHEGGFVDNPHDKGGATNFGVTQRTLDHWRGRQGLPLFSVDQLTREEAGEIYFEGYWTPLQLDEIAQKAGVAFAAILMDQAVLNGPKSVVMRLQTELGLPADGVMGPLTIAQIGAEENYQLGFRFLRASHHHYLAIVKADPTQLVFLSGWTDRLFSLMDYFFFGSPA